MTSTSNITLNSTPTKPIIPVIIDNINSNKTNNDRINYIKDTFKDIDVEIKILNKGGIVLTPKIQHHINSLLKLDKYNPEYFGKDLYIHLAGENKDLRPWLCINKISLNTEINTIRTQLESLNTLNNNIKIEGLHRKRKGPYDTTLILFKSTDHQSEETLLNKQLNINGNICHIRKYINAGQTRCTKCQKIGHRTNNCKNNKLCVMCAGDACPVGECANPIRKCVNCAQNHSSAFKNCPAIKAHAKELFNIKKHKSFEQHITEKHNNITSTQTQYNADLALIKDNQLKLNQILTSHTDQIDTLNNIIKTMQDKHLEQINLLNTQLNEQTQLNVKLQDNINTQNTLINDTTRRLDMQIEYSTDNIKKINKITYEINQAHNDIITEINELKDNDIHITKKLNKTHDQVTKHFHYFNLILPITEPDNMAIFLGEIISNTNLNNTKDKNTHIIRNIYKQLLIKEDNDTSEEHETSINTREKRYTNKK